MTNTLSNVINIDITAIEIAHRSAFLHFSMPSSGYAADIFRPKAASETSIIPSTSCKVNDITIARYIEPLINREHSSSDVNVLKLAFLNLLKIIFYNFTIAYYFTAAKIGTIICIQNIVYTI